MRPPSPRLPAFLLVLLSFVATAVGATGLSVAPDSPGKVGELGEVSQLTFTGNTTFGTDDLRRALSLSPSYLLAAHPQAQIKPFLTALEQKILGGYLYGGFRDAKVNAALSGAAGPVQVTVVEGQRSTCGPVIVRGVSRSIRTEVVQRLTKYRPRSQLSDTFEVSIEDGNEAAPSQFTFRTTVDPEGKAKEVEPPFWEAGKPARFDPRASKELQSIIRNCLAERGWLFPAIKTGIETDSANGTASLLIEISRLGPPGTVVDIEVEGNRKNSRAELLEFLGLRSGVLLSRDLFRSVEIKLWNSARFLDWTLSAEPAPATSGLPGGIRLHLRLRESDEAPALAEPFTPEQQVLVNCGRWLGKFNERSEDMVCTLEERANPSVFSGGELIFSPKQGALVTAKAGPAAARHTLLLGKQRLGLYASGTGVALKDPEMVVVAALQLLPTREGESNSWNVQFSAGFQHVSDLAAEQGTTPAFKLDTRVAPVAFLGAVQGAASSFTMEQKDLLVRGSDFLLRIDKRTGALRSFEQTSPQTTYSVRFEPGAFARASRALAKSNPNASSGSFPTLVHFGFREGALLALQQSSPEEAPSQIARAVLVLDNLLGQELFAALEDLIQSPRTRESFTLPPDELDEAIAQNNIAALLTGFAFNYCDYLFPKHSWPWTLARESAFILCSRGAYTDQELQRIFQAPETGPIGCLAAATLLSHYNAEAAKTFALQGLSRMSARDFRQDCALLLQGDGGLARGFAELAEKVRVLEPADLEALAAALPPAEAELLKGCHAALQANPGKSMSDTFGPLLDRLWNDTLRAQVRTALNHLVFPREKPDKATTGL